ncbi:TPA: hypothetical protein ACF7ZB_000202 [Kluyvera georgiana]
MADFSLPWEVVTGFFASVGVIYAFALKHPSYYTDVIEGKAFMALLSVSFFTYSTHIFIQTYSDRLIDKLNDYSAAKEIAHKQWESFSTVTLYATLGLTCYWIAYLLLGALIRSLESYKKKNSG